MVQLWLPWHPFLGVTLSRVLAVKGGGTVGLQPVIWGVSRTCAKSRVLVVYGALLPMMQEIGKLGTVCSFVRL